MKSSCNDNSQNEETGHEDEKAPPKDPAVMQGNLLISFKKVGGRSFFKFYFTFAL